MRDERRPVIFVEKLSKNSNTTKLGAVLLESNDCAINDHCEKTFALKDGLNRHMKAIHFQLKDKFCPHCKYRTSEAFNLRMHIARVHEGRKTSIQCPHCDKVVVNLTWHLQQYHKAQDVSAYLNTTTTTIEDSHLENKVVRKEMSDDLTVQHQLIDTDDSLKLLSAVSVEEHLALDPSQLIYPLPEGL